MSVDGLLYNPEYEIVISIQFNHFYISEYPQYISLHSCTQNGAFSNNLISQHINITYATQWITEFKL